MDDRSTTTLDIRVNARELSGLDKNLRQTFDPKHARELTRGVTVLERALLQTAREASKLTREMQSHRQSSGVYKDLARDLAQARNEASRLQQELAKVASGGGGYKEHQLAQLQGKLVGKMTLATAGAASYQDIYRTHLLNRPLHSWRMGGGLMKGRSPFKLPLRRPQSQSFTDAA